MVKYFCDKCGVEVYDPNTSLDMTGKVFCGNCYDEYQRMFSGTTYTYVYKPRKIQCNAANDKIKQ
jgi:hypothetical protein